MENNNSFIGYVFVRKGCMDAIQGDLLVATFYHSNKDKLIKMVWDFINDDSHQNFLDNLSQDDFFWDMEEEKYD